MKTAAALLCLLVAAPALTQVAPPGGVASSDLGDLQNVSETGEGAGICLCGDGSGGWSPATTFSIASASGVVAVLDENGTSGITLNPEVGGNVAAISDAAGGGDQCFQIGAGGVTAMTICGTTGPLTGTNPLGFVQIARPLTIVDAGARPTCGVNFRGTFWPEQAAGGDTLEFCRYDGSAYSWVDLAQDAAGHLYEDDLGGATTDITVTTAGTYYGWVSATAGRTEGSVTSDVTVTAGEPGDKLTVPAGDYAVAFAASISGTANAVFSCCVHDDGTRTAACFARKIGTGGDVGSAATGEHHLDDVGASSVLDIRCTSDGNGDTLAVESASFTVRRLGL